MTVRQIHVCGGGLRALLIADVVRRVEQVSGRQCHVSWAFEEPAAPDWNIYPPDEITPKHPASALLVNCEGAPSSVQVAGFSDDPAVDPLALRLALLELAPDQTAGYVDADDADVTLRRWRSAVAQWAHSPGAPPSRSHIESAVAAFGRLDTPRGVEVLRLVEADNQLAPGTKFETFAYLDRIVGIDVARDLAS